MSEFTMQAQIERLITTCIPLNTSPVEIERMAVELAKWQIRNIPEYGRFASSVAPKKWLDIPAVPTPLFSQVDFCICDHPKVTYLTSGTSTGARGRHLMPDSQTADIAAKTWFQSNFPSPPRRCLGLVPDPSQQPESSLGAMILALFPNTIWAFSNHSGVDLEAVITELKDKRTPLFVAATALALADTLDGLKELQRETPPLPAGSIVMITGGFKGHERRLSEQELIDAVRSRFGPKIKIVHEYGMTELSSQMWDTGDGFVAPPWLHVYTVTPATGKPCSGPGLLRFVDLANYGSCIAIETLDLGIVHGNKVTLLGRLPGSRLRGCSLTAEEAVK
jgi:hypothetical protein